jgi:hypothetical protein
VSGTTSASTISDPGKYAIVPVITGTDISDYTVSLVNGTLTITQAESAVILSSSDASSNLNTPITFTAKVSSGTKATPTGVVNFFDGLIALGSGTLNSQGVVALTNSSLGPGSHGITAVYPGNTDFNGSSSSTLTEVIIAPDYAVAATPKTLSIKQGGSGTAVITITPVGGFSQPIQFSCSGLPVNAKSAFSPTTVSPSGGSVTSTLTITTDVFTASLADTRVRSRLALALYSSQVGVCGGLMLCFLRRKRLSAYWRRLSSMLVFTLALVNAGIVIVGCGIEAFTPPGTSTVVITASTSAQGGPSHNVILTLNVIR